VTLGRADRQGDLFDEVVRFCEESLPENSIYAFLAREREWLFPDEMFADLFTGTGRRSVPPSVVATVMVLQRLEGLSDREAVERYWLRRPLALRRGGRRVWRVGMGPVHAHGAGGHA
jgi:hypothetical protein